jgi:hypothetical protein
LHVARAPHVGVDVTLEHDLHFVLLDVPVCNRCQQAGYPSPPRHDALAAIDERPPVGRIATRAG